MKKIRLILILIISLFLIGGCDEKVDCGKNPDHESCIENIDCEKTPDHESCKETIDCGKNPNHESCIENIDCEKNPDHETCIDEINYKEIEFDINLVRTEKNEKYTGDYVSLYSNFEMIYQKYYSEKRSVPIVKFHDIEDKYIAVYINKNFMLKMKNLIDRSQNAFKEKYLDEYFRMYDYDNNYIDDNGNVINKDTCPLKFYEVDKNKEIYNEYEGLELLTLIGNRTIEIVDDLYIKETIGYKEVIYFTLYGTIENNIIKVDEKYERYTPYNDMIRLKSSGLYIYTCKVKLEEGLYEKQIRSKYFAQVFELDGEKYILFFEHGEEDKTGEDALTKFEKSLLEDLNEELSRQATYELYFKNSYYENIAKMTFEEFLSKYGYAYEVYDYEGIIEKIAD